LLPGAAGWALQLATGTSVVVIAAGHVVVVQLLAAEGPEGVQDTTGTLTWLFGVQTMSTQLLPAEAVCGVHV